MLKTIQLGSCVMVQGQFVKKLSDGRITVKVDGKYYDGFPVVHNKAA